MRRISVPVALALLGASALLAHGIVNIRSNVKAEVYLDDEPLGTTPIALRDLPGGDHALRLFDPATGHSQIYNFHLSKRVTIQKEIEATFRPEDPPELIVESGFNAATGEKGYRYEERGYRYNSEPRGSAQARTRTHVHTSRDKVRIRNTALGVGTLGLITGKDALTGIGFGGALVNELVNK